MKKTTEKEKFSVVRIKHSTLVKFNYARAKAVTPSNPKYMSQDEFILYLLDKAVGKSV